MTNSFNGLIAKVRLDVEIEALTGLHVGGSDVGLKIGGADKVVVKDPKTGEPYLPGSSVKGKMRSLLEKAGFCCSGTGLVPANHRIRDQTSILACHCGSCVVCQLFGVPAEEGRRGGANRGGGEGESGSDAPRESSPAAIRCAGRLIVRDAHLDPGCAKQMASWRYLAAPFVEVKTEVSIDRLTSQANPRNFERVPAGAIFRMDLVLDVYQGDDERRFLDTIRQGLRLVANDYLGGQGTRGYGAVRIRVNQISRLDLTSGPGSDFQPFAPENWTLPWAAP